jgi:hypothetical protein
VLYNIYNYDQSCKTDYIHLIGGVTSVIHMQVSLD